MATDKSTISRLTKRLCEAATFSKPSGQRDIRWDTEIKGFGLQLHESGKKTFICVYRMPGGRKRQVTIGPFGLYTVEQAREEAADILRDARKGVDHLAERQRLRDTGTLSVLIREYLHDRANPASRAYKRSLADNDGRYLPDYVGPVLGNHKPQELALADIRGLFERVTRKSGGVTANRMLATLSSLYGWAHKTGRLDPAEAPNLCQYVIRNAEQPRKRRASDEEIQRLWPVIVAWPSGNVRVALQVLLLTGCRMNEVLTLAWENVDLERRQFTLTQTKTDTPRAVALSTPAYDLIAGLERRGPYVFPGKIKGRPFRSLHTPWHKILKQAGITNLRIHDLRHTLASRLADAGVAEAIISECLGHKGQGITGRVYIHIASKIVHETLEQYAKDLLADAKGLPRCETISLDEARVKSA